jgi:hypothetical protein
MEEGMRGLLFGTASLMMIAVILTARAAEV